MKSFLITLLVLAGYLVLGGGLSKCAPSIPKSDVAAILVVPCDAVQRVVIFTHPDGSWDSVIPAFPPSRELIQRLERTKRSQINLPCLQETLNDRFK